MHRLCSPVVTSVVTLIATGGCASVVREPSAADSCYRVPQAEPGFPLSLRLTRIPHSHLWTTPPGRPSTVEEGGGFVLVFSTNDGDSRERFHLDGIWRPGAPGQAAVSSGVGGSLMGWGGTLSVTESALQGDLVSYHDMKGSKHVDFYAEVVPCEGFPDAPSDGDSNQTSDITSMHGPVTP